MTGGLTFVQCDFDDFQRRRGLSPLTILHRHHQIGSLLVWAGRQQLDWRKLTADQINGYLDGLPASAATRAGYITMLSAFFKWAEDTGRCARNPMLKVPRPKRPSRLPRPAPDDVLRSAFTLAEPRMRAILHLAAYTGFRCCEMARLRGEDVDRAAMTIRAHGKGGKERVVPLHPDTLTALAAYRLPPSGSVFTSATVGQEFRPLSSATISRLVGQFMRGTVGANVTAHQLRHWFATSVYRSSRDLLLTRDLLGHASTATTEGYTRVIGVGSDVVAKLQVGLAS